jgi:hypothetical protein
MSEDEAPETLYTPGTLYETMTHEQMLELQWLADNRDQPGSLFLGQRIIGWRMWKGGSLHMPGPWNAVIVLADGTRVEISEE